MTKQSAYPGRRIRNRFNSLERGRILGSVQSGFVIFSFHSMYATTLNSNLVTQQLVDDTEIDSITAEGYYTVKYTTGQFTGANIIRVRHFAKNPAYAEQILTRLSTIDRKTYKRHQDNGVWQVWVSTALNSDLGKRITLSDTGVFHLIRQMVIELPKYYAIAITITPTATPTTDTPMLTFPKQLETCVLPITTGYAHGIMYANNNQMLYRLLTGSVDNNTEIVINGIVPKA